MTAAAPPAFDLHALRDAHGRVFNPAAVVRRVPLFDGHEAVVIDGWFARPEAVREALAAWPLQAPPYPYPGVVAEAPLGFATLLRDAFDQQVRRALGARRTQGAEWRASMTTTEPTHLRPVQWLCHRDRYLHGQPEVLFAAGLVYLFDEPALGGTRFYRPTRPADEIEALVADSQRLDPAAFTARWGVRPGYMAGSNAHFEWVAEVPAAFNRAVFYDGSLFHSAAVGTHPDSLSADPLRGRLTLNGFLTCHRGSRSA